MKKTFGDDELNGGHLRTSIYYIHLIEGLRPAEAYALVSCVWRVL